MSAETVATIGTWAGVGALLSTIVDRLIPHPGRPARPGETPATAAIPMLATATLFGLIAWRRGGDHELLAYSTLALLGLRLAAIDIVELRLPTPLIEPLYPAILALLGLAAVLDGRYADLLRAMAGMAILPAGYLALAILSRGGIGAGDIRLAGPIGLELAWQNWAALAIGTLLAFVYASLMAITMLTTRRSTTRPALPFGPAMLGGALTTIILPGST